MERKNNPRDNFISFFAQKLVFAVLWIHVSSQCMKITQKVTCFTQFFKREQSELSAEGLAPVAEGGVSTSTCKIHNTPKMSLCAKNEEIVMRIIFLFYAFHNVSIIKLLSKSQLVWRINDDFFSTLAKICWDFSTPWSPKVKSIFTSSSYCIIQLFISPMHFRDVCTTKNCLCSRSSMLCLEGRTVFFFPKVRGNLRLRWMFSFQTIPTKNLLMR